jgi:polyphosphate kinase 2 (PPK2 family)
MASVNQFENLLVQSDIQIIKYYLDIDKQEQAERLEARKVDPEIVMPCPPLGKKLPNVAP